MRTSRCSTLNILRHASWHHELPNYRNLWASQNCLINSCLTFFHYPLQAFLQLINVSVISYYRYISCASQDEQLQTVATRIQIVMLAPSLSVALVSIQLSIDWGIATPSVASSSQMWLHRLQPSRSGAQCSEGCGSRLCKYFASIWNKVEWHELIRWVFYAAFKPSLCACVWHTFCSELVAGLPLLLLCITLYVSASINVSVCA